MRNLKRVLSLALALVMVLGMMVITTSAADYTDAEEITYKEAVEVMSALEILNGMGDGTFAPKDTLTRAQAAKIIAYVAMGTGIEEYLAPSTPYFTDIADSWAAKYINVLVNLKVVDGNGDGTFNPKGVLTVAQFAKMLLLAAGVEGEYTGAEWKDNVKKAFNAQPALVATGLEITAEDPQITREEACHMALAAMKIGTTTVEYVVYNDADNGNDIDADEEIYSKYDNVRDAALDVQMLDTDTTNVKYKKVPTTVNLLSEIHEVTYAPATDDFGRPGDAYSWGEGADAVEMFYADKAVKTFEGPVAEKDIYAASGAKTGDYITYTLYNEGSVQGTFKACKAEKSIVVGETKENDAEWNAAGAGNGIKTELYKEVADNVTTYTVVAVREFLGTVTTVNDATEEADRSIVVTLTELANGYETTYTTSAYETEDFEEDDVVLVTVTWGGAEGAKIQTITAPKTVKGTPTKTAGAVYTIAGEEYVESQLANVTVTLGTEAEWYLDSFGNLIGNKTGGQQGQPTYYYGYLLNYANQEYVPAQASDNLLGKDAEEKAAVEIFKFIDANGDVVTLNGAVKVENKGTAAAPNWDTTFASEFSYSVDQNGNVTCDKDILFYYELDADGNIKSAAAASTAGQGADITLTKGSAPIGTAGKFGTDKTVYFLLGANNKFAVYTGYANVPTKTGDLVGWVYSETTKAVNAVALENVTLTTTTTDSADVFFADDAYTTEWDAENETTYVLYEDVYVDGVKVEGGLKFASAQSVSAGAMYTVTTTNGVNALTSGNLLTDTGVVSLIQSGFFKADSSFVYVDADTVYYQVDTTKGTIAVAEGLPAVAEGYTITVLHTVANEDETVPAVAAVYFSHAKVQG